MFLPTIDLILSLAASALSVYAIVRKPKLIETTVTHIIKNGPDSAHAQCSQCKRTVARYEPQADGSAICANCNAER